MQTQHEIEIASFTSFVDTPFLAAIQVLIKLSWLEHAISNGKVCSPTFCAQAFLCCAAFSTAPVYSLEQNQMQGYKYTRKIKGRQQEMF